MTRTQTGRSMQALSQNAALARIVGIDVARVVRVTWIVGGALACVAGVMIGILIQIRPFMGFDMLLPMFAAAILGGIGSVPGAVLGGLIIGMAEAGAVQLIGAEWRAAVSFIILMTVLFVRPIGLFGVRER
jgi:branched-chain amino acid transport system permease protein